MRKHIIAGVAALAALTAGIAIPASAASPADNTAASNFHATAPVRLVDTRQTHQTLTAGGTLKLTIAGTHGVPADATAVAVNVTAVGSTLGGFVTAYPDGTTRPAASTVNFAIGQTIANEVPVQLGANGVLDLFNLAGNTDVVVDLDGYYTAAAAPAAAPEFGVANVKVDGTIWRTFDTVESGAPAGDDATGFARFTCKNATDGCNVTVDAYSTATGETIYPDLLFTKENNVDGSKVTCENADGSDNNGATTTLTGTKTAPTSVPLGIGGTADCGGNQTGAQPASVDHINVPGAAGQGIHYDVDVMLTFAKSGS